MKLIALIWAGTNQQIARRPQQRARVATSQMYPIIMEETNAKTPTTVAKVASSVV